MPFLNGRGGQAATGLPGGPGVPSGHRPGGFGRIEAVTDLPETRYAKTDDGTHIAYQVAGDGPLDLVFMHEGGMNVEMAWEFPAFARVLHRLASFSRLIRFDQRGSGLSDPFNLAELPSLEAQALEMLAVLDAAGSDHAAVVANGTGGIRAMFFAATYPDRTSSLVLDGCYARLAHAPDYPWGAAKEVLDRVLDRVGEAHGQRGAVSLQYIAPKAVRDPEFVALWERYIRYGHSPATAKATGAMITFSDVRAALPAIQAPTLVLYRSGDRFAGAPHARYLAEHIAGAKLVELPGEENLIAVGDTDADLDEIEQFLTGARQAPLIDRVLATVLFTDIVGSTERAAQLGDRAWRELLDAHDRAVRRQLERFRGQEVKTLGDGFVATFDGPGRAIQCACAIRDALNPLDVAVRTGLHTGEIELRGDDVAGIAVHLAQRVSGLARPGEVLVSRTVTDLVAGSGIAFEDRGEHMVKGMPEMWHVYAVKA